MRLLKSTDTDFNKRIRLPLTPSNTEKQKKFRKIITDNRQDYHLLLYQRRLQKQIVHSTQFITQNKI